MPSRALLHALARSLHPAISLPAAWACPNGRGGQEADTCITVPPYGGGSCIVEASSGCPCSLGVITRKEGRWRRSLWQMELGLLLVVNREKGRDYLDMGG